MSNNCQCLFDSLEVAVARINGGNVICNTFTSCKSKDGDVISENVLLGYQF
jgi:hypothetical protein